MANIKISELPQALSVTGEELIPIVVEGKNKIIKAKLLSGAGGSDFSTLQDSKGNNYRVKIKNEKLIAYPEEVDTAEDATDNVLYDGLIINQMYGGGSALEETPVSHSFIELYNCRNNALNLKGLYLWYRAKAGIWQSLALKGIVPSKHSFLIRCGQHNDVYAECVRCPIDYYDMEWDIKLSNQGFSAYLCVGSETPEDNPVRVTKDVSGVVNWTNARYIDLLGAGGSASDDQTVWAYESRYLKCMNKNTSIHRIDYANSGSVNIGSNALVSKANDCDCEPINYLSCDVSIYRPRCLEDGRWNEFYDKPKQKNYAPNMINIAYGKNGDATRTITFQTVIADEGYVKYKKTSELTWKTLETTREIIRSQDCDSTVHRAILTGLTYGIYEYQVGFEGCWSDIASFEVKEHNQTTPMHILWTTDQQSWTIREYKVWGVVAKYLRKNKLDAFDWHLNTGDISQNANRTFEWRDYFRYSGETTRNMCHMITCGNNDLISKKYSDAFSYYITHEEPFANSVHAWDLGFTHFVCLNSNDDATYVDGQGSKGGYATTAAFLQAQADWLDTHLTEVEARLVKPRWVIVYSHLSPFTVGRVARLQRWVSVIEKHKVDMFLCGHNHAYSRSKAIKTGADYNQSSAYNDYATKVTGTNELKIVDEFKADGLSPIDRTENKAEGTVYILNQATGFKLSGKEKPITLPANLRDTIHDNGSGQPWWIAYQSLPTNPVYVDLEIGYDAITMKAYTVNGIVEYDEFKNTIVNEDLEKITENVFDTLTIHYSERTK